MLWLILSVLVIALSFLGTIILGPAFLAIPATTAGYWSVRYAAADKQCNQPAMRSYFSLVIILTLAFSLLTLLLSSEVTTTISRLLRNMAILPYGPAGSLECKDACDHLVTLFGATALATSLTFPRLFSKGVSIARGQIKPQQPKASGRRAILIAFAGIQISLYYGQWVNEVDLSGYYMNAMLVCIATVIASWTIYPEQME